MPARRIVDVLMTVLLLLLMSLQATEQTAHEYIGIAMGVLVAVHIYQNRKWFTTLFKGRYGAVRTLSTTINLALITAFILSAAGGMIISETLMNADLDAFTETGRSTHVASSYWAFVLMGLHIGMHWAGIAGKIKSFWAKILAVIFSGYGMYRFVIFRMLDYMLLRSYFVFLDYEKNSALVLLENTAMLAFCIMLGHQACRLAAKPAEWRKPFAVLCMACAVCGVLTFTLGGPETF